MKNLFSLILCLFIMKANAQTLNKKMEDPNRHKEVMINVCTREGITTFDEFKASYEPNYASYKVDSTVLKDLEKNLKGKKVTIVLGTWCGDSKYQVPNFLKIADALHMSDKDITFIAVDGSKHAENGLIDQLKIERVPTFIFTDKKGTEIGRITESPKESLEKDMLKIISTEKAKSK